MMEFFITIDNICFHFINKQLSNPIFDFIMPIFNESKFFIPLLLVPWLVLIFYDKPNRWKLLFLVPLAIMLVDQSGLWLKKTFFRPRPWVVMDPEMINHLVEPSGANLSFPSNHAANNAALAIIFSTVYYHLRFFFWSIAFIIMFSRIYIGVHYPLDVISGCIMGSFYGILIVKGWNYINKNPLRK